jgi:hypothetical protein
MIWLRQMRGFASLSCVRFAPGRANPLRGFESMVTLEIYGADGIIWLRQMRGVASLNCVRLAPGARKPASRVRVVNDS